MRTCLLAPAADFNGSVTDAPPLTGGGTGMLETTRLVFSRLLSCCVLLGCNVQAPVCPGETSCNAPVGSKRHNPCVSVELTVWAHS